MSKKGMSSRLDGIKGGAKGAFGQVSGVGPLKRPKQTPKSSVGKKPTGIKPGGSK